MGFLEKEKLEIHNQELPICCSSFMSVTLKKYFRGFGESTQLHMPAFVHLVAFAQDALVCILVQQSPSLDTCEVPPGTTRLHSNTSESLNPPSLGSLMLSELP